MLKALPKLPGELKLTLKNFYTTEAAKGAGHPWWLDLGIVKEILYTDDKGISGQTGGAVMIIRVGEPLASFYGLRTNGLYQQGDACPLKSKRPTLDFFTTNYDDLDVKLYAVDPSMIDAFGNYLRNQWNHDHPVPRLQSRKGIPFGSYFLGRDDIIMIGTRPAGGSCFE